LRWFYVRKLESWLVLCLLLLLWRLYFGSRLELCTSCYNKLSLQLGGITQSRWWSERPWIGG
jgi:hypothetical protein